MRTYSEMKKILDPKERFEYLLISSGVGYQTFGADRYLNQDFYTLSEWRRLRSKIIARDEGCEMGIPGLPASGMIHVHHMNPITPEMILRSDPLVFDPENLVCVSSLLHKFIHFGVDDVSERFVSSKIWTPRSENDTVPWRR